MFARTKRLETIMFCTSVISFLLMIIGFAKGGADLVFNGFFDYPAPTLLMLASTMMFVFSLIIGICCNGLRKDMADELRYR